MTRYHITVKFHNAETDDFDTDDYYYWIDTDSLISEKDYLILKDDVNWDALKVVKVIKAIAFNPDEKPAGSLPKAKTKALVGLANVSDYFEAKEKKRRAKEIKAQLEARFKEAEKMALYRKLAETDETMKGLIDELDSLEAGTEEDDEDLNF